MCDKTPKKSPSSRNAGFSPVILLESPAAVSPQKSLTGLPRVVRDLAADVYNSIQRWNDLHIKGVTVVKQIASVKADDPKHFGENLEQLTNDFYSLVQLLRHYKDTLLGFAFQIRALEKLQKNPEALFISLDVQALANLVEDIAGAYKEEFNLKEVVLENIAHSRNKDDAMFFAALWTYQTKITDRITLKLETLLVETGHRKIV